jgi:hypothetical protein
LAGSGGSDTCRPNAGTRFTICPSGIYVSSISLEDQAVNHDLKSLGQHKRRHRANMYSQLSHGKKEPCIKENSGRTKRKRSGKGDDNNSHEDIIYVPKDCFPSINGNFIYKR